MAGPAHETGTVYFFDCPSPYIPEPLLILASESSDSDEHFSDAQSGLGDSDNHSPVNAVTRVEKVDSEQTPSDIPGTQGSIARRSDTELDKIAPITEAEDLWRGATAGNFSREPIPSMAHSPSQDRTPGAIADDQRPEDAVPDIVFESKEPASASGSSAEIDVQSTKRQKTVGRGEPDFTDEARDALGMVYQPYIIQRLTKTGSPSPQSPMPFATRTSSEALRKGMKGTPIGAEEDGGFGDDFDDFEEGEDDAEFDDFNDGFQEAEAPAQTQPTSAFAYVGSHAQKTHIHGKLTNSPSLSSTFPLLPPPPPSSPPLSLT
jgi:hypothetical protein